MEIGLANLTRFAGWLAAGCWLPAASVFTIPSHCCRLGARAAPASQTAATSAATRPPGARALAAGSRRQTGELMR